jgi:RNA polymerase sigma-70 factor (TIGR02960 family)
VATGSNAAGIAADKGRGLSGDVVSRTLAELEQQELAAALGGNQDAFRKLTDPYFRELHVHCYRLLGSFHDAEDAMQETLLRAWRHLASFEGRSSLRAWLYRIATNVCLTWRSRRIAELPPVPPVLVDALAASREPVSHLAPYPDALLDELEAVSGNPVTTFDLRESVQLAFVAAVQLLPPRQRAALLLRDVLGFSASEVANLLDSTTASVNSALQRARATLDQQRSAGRVPPPRAVPSAEAEQRLVQRYLDAWSAADVNGLAALLTRDAVMTMPPLPLRYSGRAAIAEFLATVPAATGTFPRVSFLPTRANRQPALAGYRLDPASGTRHAWALSVLTLDGEAIAGLDVFFDTTLFAAFGLPLAL